MLQPGLADPFLAGLEERIRAVEVELTGNIIRQHAEFLVALELKTETLAAEMREMRTALCTMQDEIVAKRRPSVTDSQDSEILLCSPSPSIPVVTPSVSREIVAEDTMFSRLGDMLEQRLFGRIIAYKAIDEDPDSFHNMLRDGKCTRQNFAWAEEFLELGNNGQLDIYTCLGLSNGWTITPDTKRTVWKVVGVIVLQLVVPLVLLAMQFLAGISFKPKEDHWSFRLIGFCLFLYALYTMYGNACDLCRSHLLRWTLANQVDSGYWWPLLLGEVLNVFVFFILVNSLFVVFVAAREPIDLILNTVAVNFLGAVDSELVDENMRQDAINNFKLLFLEYGCDKKMGKKSDQFQTSSAASIMNCVVTAIIIMGLLLATVFLVAPSA